MSRVQIPPQIAVLAADEGLGSERFFFDGRLFRDIDAAAAVTCVIGGNSIAMTSAITPPTNNAH